jgi:D-3-phosphoglycerate dehydrogenase / 2-oxoglutarate reductase
VPFRVVILDGPADDTTVEQAALDQVGATVIRADLTRQSVDELVPDADAILCDATPISADLLDRAPQLQIVAEYGIGYDNIDAGAASQRGIWVTNVPGFCVEEVADHAMALILAAGRRLFYLDRSVRAGAWDPVRVGQGADRLSNQTVGLIGFGQIGRRVARRAIGFGLHVLAYSPRTTPEVAREFGAERVELNDVLRRSDYVSLHVPATTSTRGMIDRQALSRMKPSAWLINTARGSVVDETALLEALSSGRIAGAALDVRASEPSSANDPFWQLPNVILTPHASFYSAQSLLELRQRAARSVAAVLAGELPIDPVNPNIRPRFGLEAKGPDLWVS